MTSSRPLRRLFAVFAALSCATLLQPASAGAHADPSAALFDVGDRDAGMPPLSVRNAHESTNGIKWSDVPKRHWARAAIDYVGATNDWMRDDPPSEDGRYPFRPEDLESRALFARSAVRAFASDEAPDPSIAFPDLPTTDALYQYANIAVKLGWMTTGADGSFLPSEAVTTRVVHRTLVLAVGLGDLAKGLDAIHMRNGTTFTVPPDFGTLLLGMRIGLRYNHGDESLDVGPDSTLSRAEVAWSIYRAATMPSWMYQELAAYATITLPNLGPAKQRIVHFGIQYVGYPYVYSGEWYQASPPGYCCGSQPVGGFDCSGLTWWVMKLAAGGWNNVPPREYLGWALPERSSADMASTGYTVEFKDLRAGDLMFYDGDGSGTVDHVDVYIGGGWAIDSSSSLGGVTILNVADGWYRDHFVHGRRIIRVPTGA
jgi:hypothetical protein